MTSEHVNEAENFDEMAESSRKIAFVRRCLGDERGAAFWDGRSRGLELAAINLRLPTTPTPTRPSASGRDEGERV